MESVDSQIQLKVAQVRETKTFAIVPPTEKQKKDFFFLSFFFFFFYQPTELVLKEKGALPTELELKENGLLPKENNGA